MHTEPTLGILTQVTTSLGNRICAFSEKTCAAFQTRELKRERDARQRRQEKSKQKNTAGGTVSKPTVPSNSARKLKHLNLKTYKLHALGDYASTIQHFGTTDSYSTQPVCSYLSPCLAALMCSEYQSELEHRTSKTRSTRTSGRLIPQQLSKIERRQRRIHTLREKLDRSALKMEPDVVNDLRAQYNMGKSQNSPVHLPSFLQKNEGDPAVKVSITLCSFTACIDFCCRALC
jgi:hypothetical protein